MQDSSRDEREIRSPVKAVEHLLHGQPIHRGLYIGAQLDSGRPLPTFVDGQIGEAAGGELADGRAAVDVVDGFQVDVEAVVEIALEPVWRCPRLFVGERTRDHVDSVAPYATNPGIAF